MSYSKQVLYGGLFTVSRSSRCSSMKRSRRRLVLSAWLRKVAHRNSQFHTEKGKFQVQGSCDSKLPRPRSCDHISPNPGSNQLLCDSVHGNSVSFTNTKPTITGPRITTTTTATAFSPGARVRLPEVRDPIGAMQMADIYALGIVLFELYHQNEPYVESRQKPQEIIRRVVVLNDQFRVCLRLNYFFAITGRRAL